MNNETTPELQRALTLRDLVLFNLVAVIGIGWVATSAKAGPSVLTLWLLAAVLFFIPQGLAVIQLSSSFPTRAAFMPGPRHCLAKDTVLFAVGVIGSITCSFIRRCFWGPPSPPPTSF